MNYYYPYYNIYPYMNASLKPSLFSRILGGIKGINFGSIISNTQKTLNVVNQTIPLVKQVTPVMKNAKTMFKVMNEFKRVNTPTSNKNSIKEQNNVIEDYSYNDGPNFFV